MTDYSLHDKVTFIIRDNFPELWAQADDIADVLIRELSLTTEWSIGGDDSRVLWLDGEEPVIPRDGEFMEVRWVSAWSPASGCIHPGCTCERCQREWCGDVGNVVYHRKGDG